MEFYRPIELAYLVVPILLGVEFLIAAFREKAKADACKVGTPLGTYMLGLMGIVFCVMVPLMFVFVIWVISKSDGRTTHAISMIDRYGVMFMYLGAWWQVYLIAALKAKRAEFDNRLKQLYLPLLALGIYISLLVLWVFPFGLKWVSMAWFIALTGALYGLKIKLGTVSKIFWVFSGMTFVFMIFFFIFLDSVV